MSDDKVRCPKCGSDQIHAERRGVDYWTGILFKSQIVVTCLACGHKFLPGQGGGARPTAGYQATSLKSDRSFEAEAVLRGFPYRVRENGSIEAMMAGGLVHFRDMEQFRAAAEGRDEVPTKTSFDPDNPILDPLSNLPAGSRIERKFRRRVAFLPDGSVIGETDSGVSKFKTFEEWQRTIGE
jgi:ribosomal protein S27E